ncbi:MAG: ABC transporter permease [Chitinophagaceae bacterium]|nr:ABC transporter permease [Chitinophagaceae bacterium]
MFKNHFKTAVRNFLRRKDYFMLNMIGLSVGITCWLLILQYVSYEKGYDAFPKADRIARLTLDNYQQGKLDWQSAAVYPAFGPNMKKDFPEVENYCRLAATELLLSNDEHNIRANESKGYYADPSFLSMFDIRMLKGNPQTALDGLDKIMLSEDLAKKYFGDANPLGKTLVYRAPFTTKIFEVSGVFTPPSHAHLVINYLISYPTIGSFRRQFGDLSSPEETSWGWYQFYTYLLMKPGIDLKKLEEKFPAFCDRYINHLDWKKAGGIKNEVHLMPLKNIHLHSHYMQEAEINGNEQSVSFLFLVSFFIIGIAWVNYVNLSTARSLERAKEVGVRKVAGATRSSLVVQFLIEGILLNLIAFAVALSVASFIAPGFSKLTGNILPTTFRLTNQYRVLAGGILLAGTLLSAVYPAFVLSAFKPATVLKGLFKNSAGGLLLRKALIVVQFTASIVLIAGTIIVYKQLRYMRSQPLNVNIKQTVVLEGAGSPKDSVYQQAFQPFKNAVLQLPGVKSVTASTSVMGRENFWANNIPRSGTSNSNPVTLYYLGVDYDFIPSYEIKVVAGRNFSKHFPSDSNAALLNETAVRMLGFNDPKQVINQKIGSGITIIGVVQDYHTEALHKAIDPQLIILRTNARNVYSVKIETANVANTLADIRTKWNANFPADPFSYYFLDEAFDKQYKADKQFGAAFGFFSCIAIVIACLGLLGLSAYSVLQRAKEIGIRKVFGASTENIVRLLSKDFVKLVLIAFIMAIPVAWWVMQSWLQQFAYHIKISWFVFVIAGATALLIALITISFQAIRAAVANPVAALRSE